MTRPSDTSEIVLYQTEDGKIKIDTVFQDETIWLTQARMAELFDVNVPAISKHLNNIFEDGELQKEATVSKMETVQQEGSRQVTRTRDFYNLDAIIAVGYRVNSKRATQFRIWATHILKEYIIKGFAMDDDRLKQAEKWDYFDEWLERIRDIRASDKRFYQKVRDLFALSSDYDPTDKATQMFFAETQNKLLYAVTGKTAAEIIVSRADASKENMALTSWKGSIVRKQDIFIAKNYLSKDEIDILNRLVVIFLETAELRAKERMDIPMSFWKENVDRILEFNDKKVLTGKGSISNAEMEQKVREIYSEFDARRKAYEADLADKQDIEEIEAIIKNHKK
jgi:hypothetical protein